MKDAGRGAAEFVQRFRGCGTKTIKHALWSTAGASIFSQWRERLGRMSPCPLCPWSVGLLVQLGKAPSQSATARQCSTRRPGPRPGIASRIDSRVRQEPAQLLVLLQHQRVEPLQVYDQPAEKFFTASSGIVWVVGRRISLAGPDPRAGERREEWWHAAVFRFEVLQKCTSWVWYIQDACAEHAAGASLLSRVPLEDGNGVGRRPHDHFGPGPQGLQGGPGQPRVGVDAERAVAHRAIPVQSLPPVPQAADPALV